MNKPEDSQRDEPDPLIQQFTDWRNELLAALEWLRTGPAMLSRNPMPPSCSLRRGCPEEERAKGKARLIRLTLRFIWVATRNGRQQLKPRGELDQMCSALQFRRTGETGPGRLAESIVHSAFYSSSTDEFSRRAQRLPHRDQLPA